jgi:hypothetical protein
MSIMAIDWNNDEQLIADLGEALRAEQKVPVRLVEIGKAAFAWHSVDGELAELTFDSAAPSGQEAMAGTRAEPAAFRAMTFAASELNIELEVITDALVGQVAPPQPGEIEVRLRDDSAGTVMVNDVGWFEIRPRPVGPFRLHMRPADGGEVFTEWISL